MDILIGKIIKFDNCSNKGASNNEQSLHYALEIPGIGIVENNRYVDNFACVTLDKYNLIKLREQIEKELENEQSNME